MSIISHCGEGTMSDLTFRQITKCCHCGCYHFNKNGQSHVSRIESASQTEWSFKYNSYLKDEHQDMIRPYYIKEEIAPETNSVLQNNGLSQQLICTCAERGVCPLTEKLEICNAGPEERMQEDAEAQVDLFELDEPIKCMTCAKVLPDRSCCIRRYIVTAYECSSCYAKSGNKTGVTSYLQVIRGQYAAASLKTVPCEVCLKFFGTVKGMRIHQGRVHKPFVVKR